MHAHLARGVVIALGFASLSLAGYARFAPPDPPEARGSVPGTVVLDAHGNVLERDGRSGMRIPIGLGSVAPRMLQATISAEDRRFQQHPGVDPLAIARAAITSDSQPSGASTITQQLARRLYLAGDASPLAVRKAREALVALQLEANRSKREILELYLNDVYYGRGAYGVEAASRLYFGIGSGNDGLVIETTLDAGLQNEAERLIRIRLDEFQGRNVTNAALVAIEPGTGRILSFVGSATDGDPLHGGEIDMVLTPRQPGSALKPFLYAAAFERGFTPATALLDVATSFPTEDGPYTPLDFDRSFHGVVPLRVALASSLNIPAVRTLDALGLDAMLEMTHRFGLGTLSEVESYGLGLTLGGGEVRLLDLANAYAALGAGGRLAQPFAVARVRDAAGRVLYERSASPPVRVLSDQRAYLLADVLSDPDARIPGFGGVTPFELPFAAAVKSGTSTGFRDDWTLGYTPESAAGVWVGNADRSPLLNVAGAHAAGPIRRDTMTAAALVHPMNEFVRPAGIVETTVCAPTGLLPGPDCPSPVRELFVAGTEQTAQERYYARDAEGRITVDPPTEARDWARAAGLAIKTDGIPPARDQLRVVAPVPGSTVYLAPELRTQELVLRAAAASGIDRVTFAVDGVTVGTAPAAAPWTTWALEVGLHTLRLSAHLPDGSTATASSLFEVKR